MDREQLSKRLDKAFEEYSKPLELPEPSGHWISAAKARELIWNETRTNHFDRSAERALARRICIIPAKVVGWEYSWEPQEGLSRLDLIEAEPDHSDWSAAPSRIAFSRRINALSRIGDDPNDYLLTGDGLVDACWISGDFKVVLDGDFRRETVHLIGLAFDEVALREAFDFTAFGSLEAPSSTQALADVSRESWASAVVPAAQNIGGRPASRHGDVLAAATLRLADLKPSALRRYTAEALASELETAYRSAGESPPSERNRLLFASGILRVIRARQT